jgi:hypothetical protein
MVYLTSLTNIIGKTKALTIKNILFNMHYRKLIREKGKLSNVSCKYLRIIKIGIYHLDINTDI